MRKLVTTQLLISVLLAGCSSASAKGADANDDLDCAVITYHYLKSSRVLTNEHQRYVVLAIASWYAAKMQKRSAETGKTMEQVMMPGAALLAAVDRNPKAFGSVSDACAHRAIDDPHFDEFVRNLKVPDNLEDALKS